MNSQQTESTERQLRLLHDAELIGLSIDRAAKTTTLKFGRIDGVKVEIAFKSVLTIRISNLFLQNVVSRALLSSFDDIPIADIQRIVAWAFSDEQASLLIEEADLQKHVRRVVEEDRLRLLYVDPSWGAEIAIIYEEMEIVGQ